MRFLKLIAVIITICGFVKCKTLVQSEELQPDTLIPLFIRLETNANHQSIDGVVNVCNSIQPIKTFLVQSIVDGKAELKIIFDNISHSNRQLLVQHIQQMKQVRLLEMSY